jgi:hypothetical protein
LPLFVPEQFRKHDYKILSTLLLLKGLCDNKHDYKIQALESDHDAGFGLAH